jgi:polyhydroxyalkanoate synthase
VADWFAERSVVEDERAADADAVAADADAGLQQLDGIGPAYASRLVAAGVDSVETLADADPAVVAADTDIDEGRIRRWIEAAAERTA